MKITRRDFLGNTTAVAIGFLGLRHFVERGGLAQQEVFYALKGAEELQKGHEPLIKVPEGFTAQIFSSVGEIMDDSLKVPGRHDGMCAFPGPDGKTILIRNHELEPKHRKFSPFGDDNRLLTRIQRGKMYDYGKGRKPGLGGTTTLVYNTREQRLERHFMSLAGTHRNCAGGPTPWNTWISCEETVVTAGRTNERNHGYNFEVPVTDQIGLVDPVPLTAMGRFNHEAIAVHPETGIIYQTEDRHDGLFYRFIPHAPGHLIKGGKLQALVIRGTAGLDTRNWRRSKVRPGEPLPVSWVDLEEVDSPVDNLRYRGRYWKGAACFARGEGIWYGKDAVYFACTNGGRIRKGQIRRYYPSPVEGTSGEHKEPGRLELFLEPNNPSLIEKADNLTIAPWGDLIVCEDGRRPQFLVRITPEGKFHRFAETWASELTGVTFSPDGSTLFVNIQNTGKTVAITGPWEQLMENDAAPSSLTTNLPGKS